MALQRWVVVIELGVEKTIFFDMNGKIKINAERCKGCGLCIVVCPKKHIGVSAKSNKQGYFPAEVINIECTGCGQCAIVCPDAVIEVYRENITKGTPTDKKEKNLLIKEKK